MYGSIVFVHGVARSEPFPSDEEQPSSLHVQRFRITQIQNTKEVNACRREGLSTTFQVMY
jgi:hypothetical protein